MKFTNCELYPTVITPFDETGKIDYESAMALIELFYQNACDGIFAVCQSSEMFFLAQREKLELAAFFIRECHKRGMRCVISGHTEDTLEEQLDYLIKAEALKPDAIILVTNRLVAEEEPDEAFIERLKQLIGSLRPETRLGLYECPYPYKRLISPKMLEYVISTERFDFIKDTCCDVEMMKRRVEMLQGSGIKLFNANAATLTESLENGAAGFSGVVLNFVPELFSVYKKLCKAGLSTRQVAMLITICSVYEYQLYPCNAKYYLKNRGIIKCDYTRSKKNILTEAQKDELHSLMRLVQQEIHRYTASE